MDLTSETRLCHHDDVANNLLFLEAQQQIKRGVGGGGGGVICATPEQARQLEEFADPSFPAERQFLDLARSLPGYGALVAKDVVMETDLISNDINLHRGNIVTCRLERQRLVILTAEVKEAVLLTSLDTLARAMHVFPVMSTPRVQLELITGNTGS